MLNLITTGLFLISAAIAAAGIMIVSQLRTKFRFDSLLYMQVFYFMFGFYAIWGQVIIVSYVAPLIDTATLDKVHEVLLLLGSPFIVFGWLMFLRFINDFNGFINKRVITTAFLIVNFGFLVSLFIFNSKFNLFKALDILKMYFIISNFIYCSVAAILLARNRKPQMYNVKSKNILVLGIILFMVTQNLSLYFYGAHFWSVLVFIFLFFMGTAFIPIFLKYNLQFPESKNTNSLPVLSFESFCTKFEISPREKDIIVEICNGLSNQQIADKLFISLQTVKDHTHRIYGKTMATSRMQLMKMVQEASVR